MSETVKDKVGDDSTSDDVLVFPEPQKLTQMDRIEARIDSFEKNLKNQIKEDLKESIHLLSSRTDGIEKDLNELNEKFTLMLQNVMEMKEMMEHLRRKKAKPNEMKKSKKEEGNPLNTDEMKKSKKEEGNPLNTDEMKISKKEEDVKHHNTDELINSLKKEEGKYLQCIRCNEIIVSLTQSQCRYHNGGQRKWFGQYGVFGMKHSDYYFRDVWMCCFEHYFKLKPGHERSSNHDLMKDEDGRLIVDHSTGCKKCLSHETK